MKESLLPQAVYDHLTKCLLRNAKALNNDNGFISALNRIERDKRTAREGVYVRTTALDLAYNLIKSNVKRNGDRYGSMSDRALLMDIDDAKEAAIGSQNLVPSQHDAPPEEAQPQSAAQLPERAVSGTAEPQIEADEAQALSPNEAVSASTPDISRFIAHLHQSHEAPTPLKHPKSETMKRIAYAQPKGALDAVAVDEATAQTIPLPAQFVWWPTGDGMFEAGYASWDWPDIE